LADPAIRPATPGDAAAVQAIYAFHVAHGTASFDTEAPDVAFWEEKIAHILTRGWPFLAIEVEGKLAGYAYASQFRDRAAYAHTCENSIYIDPDRRGTGLGKRLLAALIGEAQARGFEQMIAVIGGGEPASVALHARCGFEHAGRMKRVGRKFGRVLDTVYMQRDLTA
jgi:L-amino acid N-acyltransferase YncA